MPMRLTGLASGMDVDSMVTKMLKARKVPVDQMSQKRQTLQWTREAFRDMNTKITDFRNNKLFNYRLESTFAVKNAEVTGVGASSISAKVTGDAQVGQITIDVVSLATAAMKQSSSDIRKVTGGTSNFDAGKTLLSQKDNLNTTVSDATYKLVMNGKEISVVTKDQSLNDVISQINRNTEVNAYYDSAKGKMSFTTKGTGTAAKIDFAGSDSAFLTNVLNVTIDSGASIPKGTDAVLKINGIDTTRASNTFTVNGVNVTLNSAGAGATINVKTDTDKIVENVKNFIKDYNEFIKTVNDKVGETRYKDFPPLTDEQKKEMKETDVKIWEEKSRSGLLHNDDILTGILSKVRYASTAKVDNGDALYNSINSLGIVTGPYSEKGKLYLTDEKKLRAAIEANSNAVAAIFTAKGIDDDDTSKMGIAERMYVDIGNRLKDITKKVGYVSLDDSTSRDDSFLGKQIYELNTKINAGTKQLKKYENQYYRQFAAMESAMSKFNSQATYLQNAFSSGKQ